MNLDGRAGRKELGVVEGKEIIIRIHYVGGKNIYSQRGEQKTKTNADKDVDKRDPHILLT